jgi:GntR family transcriptional repressor for pyruvate dehydrogenase complex
MSYYFRIVRDFPRAVKMEAAARKPRSLALNLADAIAARIAAGKLAPGARLPTEAGVVGEFRVSRTVVREALSMLQAAGLVETRHGVGTFVREGGAGGGLALPSARHATTLLELLAVVELRLALESEAAALAAARRDQHDLQAMQAAQRELAAAIEGGEDSVGPDRRLHEAIAHATRNAHFVELMDNPRVLLIPRSRLDTPALGDEGRRAYLRRVHAEHDSIVSAITNHDPEGARAAMRTHLSNSRERLRRAQEHAVAVPVV